MGKTIFAFLPFTFGAVSNHLVCDDDGKMTYTYTHDRTTFLNNQSIADISGCTTGNITVTTTEDNGGTTGEWKHVFEIDPVCTTNPVTALDMRFSLLSDVAVIGEKATANLKCSEPDSVYSVSYDFGAVSFDDTNTFDVDAGGITFGIKRMTNGDYDTEQTSNTAQVGEAVYFQITSNNQNFEFDVGTCT